MEVWLREWWSLLGEVWLLPVPGQTGVGFWGPAQHSHTAIILVLVRTPPHTDTTRSVVVDPSR